MRYAGTRGVMRGVTMATRIIPASKVLVCDICGKQQPEHEATAPFGLFTHRGSVTITKHRFNCEIPLKFDTCNDCMDSVGRYVSSLLAVARGMDEPWVIPMGELVADDSVVQELPVQGGGETQ